MITKTAFWRLTSGFLRSTPEPNLKLVWQAHVLDTELVVMEDVCMMYIFSWDNSQKVSKVSQCCLRFVLKELCH